MTSAASGAEDGQTAAAMRSAAPKIVVTDWKSEYDCARRLRMGEAAGLDHRHRGAQRADERDSHAEFRRSAVRAFAKVIGQHHQHRRKSRPSPPPSGRVLRFRRA